MRRQWLRSLAAAAAPIFALAIPTAPAQANPGVLVYPGMEIHQGSSVCTLGFVDLGARTAYTAGHCRGNGPVVDRATIPSEPADVPRQHPRRGDRRDRPHDLRLGGHQPWTRCRRERHPARRTCLGLRSGRRADPGSADLSLRRDHRRELRHRRSGEATAGSPWPTGW